MDPILTLIVIIAIGFFLYYKRQQVVKSQESRLKSEFQFQDYHKNKNQTSSLSKTFGETNAVCPYCNIKLEKKPSRKKQCPHCKNDIYKRTRPYDGEHIILREDQLEDFKEQKAIENGQHELFLKEKKRKQKIKDRLTNQYGNSPTRKDVEFRALNERATEFELKGHWGFGRNMRLKMATNLEDRESYKKSFRLYCHLCYIDINGPQNRSEMPFFNPKTGNLAPGVIKRMEKIIDRLNYDVTDIKTEFIDVTTPIYQDSPTPIPPKKAWPKLKQEFTAT